MRSPGLGGGEPLATSTATLETATNGGMLLDMEAHVEAVALRLHSAAGPFTSDGPLASFEVLRKMGLNRWGQYKVL